MTAEPLCEVILIPMMSHEESGTTLLNIPKLVFLAGGTNLLTIIGYYMIPDVLDGIHC